MGVVRPLRAGVATLATAGLAIGGSQFFAPPAQATNSSVKARVSARTAVNIRAQAVSYTHLTLPTNREV